MKYLLFILLFIISINVTYSQTKQWKIIWDKNPESDIKEYIVYKGDKEISRVKSPDTVYVDTKLEPGILYSYRIKAVNEKNIPSDFSDPATAAIPGFNKLPTVLGILKSKPTKLFLKDYIIDPDDSTHEIKRKNIPVDSKISVTLDGGNLIFKASNNWSEQDTESVKIEITDSHGFFNVAIVTIKDESIVEEIVDSIPQELDIKIFPVEFSLSQFSKIIISNIPKKSNISIHDSFGNLVFLEKNISFIFSWDAKNNDGDQVLFGMYNFFIYDKNNNIINEGYFRVIP